MNSRKDKIVNRIKSVITMTIGSITASFAITGLLAPNQIFDGGVVGTSMLLSQKINVSMNIIMCMINAPIVVYGYLKSTNKVSGRKFTLKVIYSMLTFSLCSELLANIKPLTQTPILATIAGGVVLGLGVGLIIHEGGCVDGTEVIGTILSKEHDISITQFVLMFNLVLYTLAGFMFSWDRALYSMISYFITFKVIDVVSVGWDETKAVKIITANATDIAKEIYSTLGRTCTLTKGIGLATHSEVDIIYVVLTRIEISELKQIVKNSDISAFITVMSVDEIIGTHMKKVNPKVAKELSNL